MEPLITEAVALWQRGRHQDAENICTAILAAESGRMDARGLLAEVYSSSGRFADAATQLRMVADHQPNDAAAHRRLGDALFASKDFPGAVQSFRHAISLEFGNPRAHNNLGRALAQLGEHAAAADCYRQALALDPKYAIAHNNLGIALVESGEFSEASACYDRAIALNPRLMEAFVNQGNLQLRLGEAEKALASYERAVSLDPRNPTVHCNHAGALRELRRLEPALASYKRALQLQPGMLDALSNKALALLEMNRFEETVACCDGLLKHSPESAAGWLYRGLALKDLKRYADSAESFERLLRVDPNQYYTLGYLQFARSHACDWSQASIVADGLREVQAGKPAITPLVCLSLTDDARLQLECARIAAKHSHPPAQKPLWTGRRVRREKIRLAYLSSDFRDHALSYLMTGVFEKHDRSRFEVIAVSYQRPANTAFGLRVMTAFDAFVDVGEQSDTQTAQVLHKMEIDIAIDLMGYTRGQRLNIFSHRFAPVQVGYLGFPGTSGTAFLDYLIADEFVIPPDSRQHYSEAVVYMPECFQANDDKRVISDSTPTRSAAGLPEDAFVFCSFNNCYKITASVFDIWCRLLRARPGSVLWMLADNDETQQNLMKEASSRGVDPSRLYFAGRIQYEDHLARLRLADLFLDTLPFSAGATASDALWAGLPIVTRTGSAFASRMAGSLLRTIGLPELITESADDYERLALHLATDPTGLAAIRAKLRANRATYPLFDTERFTRHLESAYVTMYERYLQGAPADALSVPPLSVPALSPSSPLARTGS
jgi:protein O-GlcNAc transferase